MSNETVKESGEYRGIKWELTTLGNYYILLSHVDLKLFDKMEATPQGNGMLVTFNLGHLQKWKDRYMVYANGIKDDDQDDKEFFENYKKRMLSYIDIIYNSYALDGKKYLESEEAFNSC